MPRNLVGSLIVVGLSTLSCDVVSFVPAPALPPVSASASAGAGAARSVASTDPVVAAVERFLRARRTGLVPEEISQLARTIVDESARHDIEPGLVLAVMHVESRYYNFAVSPVGALGLMQILPPTGEWLADAAGIPWDGPTTLFDPCVNVRLGVAYLRQLADRYESLDVALAAYNWGPSRIDRRIRQGTPLPKRYARLVREAYGSAVEAQRS